jgi:CRP-like cAMP-binding protein
MNIDWERIPYFAGLNAYSQARIEHAAHRRAYQAGATIFSEGDRCAGFHLILDGLVRIYRTSAEGRLHTLSLLNTQSTFNEVAAVDGGPNPFNAVAVTNTTVLVIAHDSLLGLMATDSRLLSNTVQALAHLNRDYIERLEDMTFRTIPSRLAKLFLHETTYGDQICDSPSKLTQEEMASILGTTREVVGRALRSLMNAGLLKKRGRSVYVVDREGLEYLAVSNMMPERIKE